MSCTCDIVMNFIYVSVECCLHKELHNVCKYLHDMNKEAEDALERRGTIKKKMLKSVHVKIQESGEID